MNKPGDQTMWTLPNKGSEVSKTFVLEMETCPRTEQFRSHVNACMHGGLSYPPTPIPQTWGCQIT